MPRKKQWVRDGARIEPEQMRAGRPRGGEYARTYPVAVSAEQVAALKRISAREQNSIASIIRAGVRLVIAQYERRAGAQ